MKSFVVAFALVAIVLNVSALEHSNTAFGYIKNIGIPRAEQIRKAEEEFNRNPSRIVNGVPAALGQYPWQAGLLTKMVGIEEGVGVCGASLVSADRLLTAAHCWYDGVNQAWKVTVVLGSVQLFTGGTRLDSSTVIPHPNWSALLVRNDIAVIYLPTTITFTANIAPVGLPYGSMLEEDFVDEYAIASGFGLTADDASLTTQQSLSHVSLHVITNRVCSLAFPLVVKDSNICTSGFSGSTCNGDSGGPLVLTRNNKPYLIGITSFGTALGCESKLPAAFTRVTSFMDFINKNL